MRKEYEFSKATKNTYVTKVKKQITIRLDEDAIEYFDGMGNPVINPEYNPAQLSEALCKLEAFTYAPSETRWWQHGHSSERDFIYVTTQNLSADQLQALLVRVVACARDCVAQAGLSAGGLDAVYLTGGSSALRPFQRALQAEFPSVPLVEGDLFGGVASGLAYTRV